MRAARGGFVRISMELDRRPRTGRSHCTGSYATRGTTTSASCCRRPAADARRLLRARQTSASARASTSSRPSLAFQDFDEDPRKLPAMPRALVAEGAYVGIATHDEHLIEALRSRRDAGCARPITSSRCCSASAPDRARRARRSRTPPAGVRPVRHGLVRVLRSAAAGEPEDRRRRCCRDLRPACSALSRGAHADEADEADGRRGST